MIANNNDKSKDTFISYLINLLIYNKDNIFPNIGNDITIPYK